MGGGNLPLIRFNGFESEWILIKFKDMAELRRGLTYSPTQVSNDGIRVLRSCNIDADTFVMSDDDVFVTLQSVTIPLVKDGDILITAANGSPRLVGKHCVIKDTTGTPVVHGGFMLIATSEEPDFLNASMGSDWFKAFQTIGISGGNGAIGNLDKTELEEFSFYIPREKAERDRIATFFRTLDAKISLQTQRIEKLKQLKFACLNKMIA